MRKREGEGRDRERERERREIEREREGGRERERAVCKKGAIHPPSQPAGPSKLKAKVCSALQAGICGVSGNELLVRVSDSIRSCRGGVSQAGVPRTCAPGQNIDCTMQ